MINTLFTLFAEGKSLAECTRASQLPYAEATCKKMLSNPKYRGREISEDLFDTVQLELARRNAKRKPTIRPRRIEDEPVRTHFTLTSTQFGGLGASDLYKLIVAQVRP